AGAARSLGGVTKGANMNRAERLLRPVTIFGGGIAGLSAAHELVMRGFTVEIIDAEYNKPSASTLDRGIGGMARSQWAIALNDTISGDVMKRLWTGAELLREVSLLCDAGNVPIDLPTWNAAIAKLGNTILEIEAAGEVAGVLRIVVHGVNAAGLPGHAGAQKIRADLVAAGHPGATVDSMFEPRVGSPLSHVITFEPSGKIVAAEHGFRFFPSFYRHLFDTMRRTPITYPQDSERTRATVFENLVPSEGLGFARGGDAVSFMIPRRQPSSLEAVRKLLDRVLDELGYTIPDLTRFSLKLFKYMTSSTKRRREQYENMSWGDFLEAWRYSPVSREHIEYGPQMSAALRGSESDARTQGNITTQLLMDQLKEDALADYALCAPTSGAWLDHWYDFLDSQGVKFKRGKLTGFMSDGANVWPVVDGEQHTGKFFIIALSLPALAPLVQSFLDATLAAGIGGTDDMVRAKAFAGDLASLTTPSPTGPLQHLSGIQYYFDEEVRFWRGHTQYLDSAWGLTSIAQPQFWARPRTPDDDYWSILSVDIGIFDRLYQPKTPGLPPKMAWNCTAQEIAEYAWEQIIDHHDNAFKEKYGPDAEFPTPCAYALDGTLGFIGNRNGPIGSNGSPFLVNKTSAYETRPGKVTTAPGESKCISCYQIMAARYVLAGTHMQTYTRLTSMESANESARHAVNSLLQHWRIGGDRCDIWDPEDHEVEDFQSMRDLDEELYDRGLPHFTDILGWSELPDYLPDLSTLLP
ncbi:MAG TPA: NAD(P)-binding protein, partial [Kofleriaceae bacterium]